MEHVPFNEIIVFGELSLFQLAGFITILGALATFLANASISFLLWRSSLKTGKRLRDDRIFNGLESLFTCLMGYGGYGNMPTWFWDYVYLCRAGLFILMPFVIWRLWLAFKDVLRISRDLYGSGSD